MPLPAPGITSRIPWDISYWLHSILFPGSSAITALLTDTMAIPAITGAGTDTIITVAALMDCIAIRRITDGIMDLVISAVTLIPPIPGVMGTGDIMAGITAEIMDVLITDTDFPAATMEIPTVVGLDAVIIAGGIINRPGNGWPSDGNSFSFKIIRKGECPRRLNQIFGQGQVQRS